MVSSLMFPGIAVLALAAAALALGVRWWLHHEVGEPVPAAKPPARPAPRARVKVQPASLAGRVVAKADGAWIAGAVVSVVRVDVPSRFREDRTEVVEEGPDGTWRIDELEPGEYAVSATARGFLSHRFGPIRLAAAEVRERIEIALDTGGSVARGRVRDLDGVAIAKARITATGLAGPAFVTLTDEKGAYELGLPDGQFALSANHDAFVAQQRPQVFSGTQRQLDFALLAGAVIRGQVIARDTGDPVEGTFVTLANERVMFGHRAVASTFSRADGTFELCGLNPGPCMIAATGDGFASSAPVDLLVDTGQRIDGIHVVVDVAHSISGRVVKRGTQEGFPGCTVRLIAHTREPGIAAVLTDATGAFRLDGARPGTYQLLADIGNLQVDPPELVEVIDGDVTGVVIELGPRVKLSGRVEPACRTTLLLSLSWGPRGRRVGARLSVETDAAGAFEFRDVPPGEFTIRAFADERGGKLDVSVGDSDQTGLVVALESRTAITGRVIDTNGNPVADATVTAGAPNVGGSPGSRTSVDGAFRIGGLAPGHYVVLGCDEQVEVELTANSDLTGVTLVVPARDGVLRGLVVDRKHHAVRDAWISFSWSRYTHPSRGSSTPLFRWAAPIVTREDGLFAVPEIPSATYKVIAESARGDARGEANIETGWIGTIELVPLAGLTLQVTHRGRPVREFEVLCDSGMTVHRHVTTSDGRFTIERLSPGEHTCTVIGDAGTATANVTMSSKPQKLALALQPWATLTGTVVTMGSRQPVAGLGLVVDAPTTPAGGAPLRKGPSTDVDGRFTLTRVPADRVTITLTRNDYSQVVVSDLKLKPGESFDMGVIEVKLPEA